MSFIDLVVLKPPTERANFSVSSDDQAVGLSPIVGFSITDTMEEMRKEIYSLETNTAKKF